KGAASALWSRRRSRRGGSPPPARSNSCSAWRASTARSSGASIRSTSGRTRGSRRRSCAGVRNYRNREQETEVIRNEQRAGALEAEELWGHLRASRRARAGGDPLAARRAGRATADRARRRRSRRAAVPRRRAALSGEGFRLALGGGRARAAG